MATFTYHLSRGWGEIKLTVERETEQSKSKSHLVLWCGTRRRTHSRVRARWKTKSRKKKSFDGWRCSVCRLTLGSAVAFSGMTSVSTKRSALVTSKLASSVFYSTALLIPSTMILNSSSLVSGRDSTRNSLFTFYFLLFNLLTSQISIWIIFSHFGRVDLKFPKIEVRFQNLMVESFVHVGSRALPTIPNFIINMAEVISPFLFIFYCVGKWF